MFRGSGTGAKAKPVGRLKPELTKGIAVLVPDFISSIVLLSLDTKRFVAEAEREKEIKLILLTTRPDNKTILFKFIKPHKDKLP